MTTTKTDAELIAMDTAALRAHRAEVLAALDEIECDLTAEQAEIEALRAYHAKIVGGLLARS